MKPPPAGYSGTPLAKKLGYAPGMSAYLDGAPDHYAELVAPLPADVTFPAKLKKGVPLVHLFTASAVELAKKLRKYRTTIAPDGMVWVSWPKKAAKVPTDITEDVIREVCLPMGFVDVKVCAVDATWSGLKLVIRKELRTASPVPRATDPRRPGNPVRGDPGRRPSRDRFPGIDRAWYNLGVITPLPRLP